MFTKIVSKNRTRWRFTIHSVSIGYIQVQKPCQLSRRKMYMVIDIMQFTIASRLTNYPSCWHSSVAKRHSFNFVSETKTRAYYDITNNVKKEKNIAHFSTFASLRLRVQYCTMKRTKSTQITSRMQVYNERLRYIINY